MKTNFQSYNQQKNWLFPPSIEERIPQEHPVRVLNGLVEQLDLSLLVEEYNKEGKPSYHPAKFLQFFRNRPSMVLVISTGSKFKPYEPFNR